MTVWDNRDRDYNVRCLVRRLQRIDKEMSGEARELFAAYIPNGDMGRYAAELTNKLRKDFTNTMSLLRKQEFQDLLVHYPRAQRTFVVAYEAQESAESSQGPL